jgi:hypothetical protein
VLMKPRDNVYGLERLFHGHHTHCICACLAVTVPAASYSYYSTLVAISLRDGGAVAVW